MAQQRAAAASEVHAAQCAREVLAFGNAVDAVVAGVLVAAAESPSVFLGPVQMLVGGTGAGLRAVDGRVRQPGLGIPRPRGLVASDAVPAAARVGVPALPAALAAALASLGSATMLRVAGEAIARARSRSPERAAFIEAFARRGAGVMAEDAIADELTAAAGRASNGALTTEDLESVRPALVGCVERSGEVGGLYFVPWRADGRLDASFTHIVVAADAHGLLAIACYEVSPEGLAVPALGVVAPPFAAPVRRGEVRVRPGEARPAAAPIALRAVGGVVDLAFGLAESAHAEQGLDAVAGALACATTVGAAFGAAPTGQRIAIVRTSDAAAVLGWA